MRIFHVDWVNKKQRMPREFNIDANLWVIGSFILGILVGAFFL